MAVLGCLPTAQVLYVCGHFPCKINICTKLELFCLGRVLVDQHIDLRSVGPEHREREMEF